MRNAKSHAVSRKGQMIQQVFIFILAGLIFVLIVSYGYRAIQFFLERQEQVVLVDVQHKLEVAVEQVKRDFQSVRRLDVDLPSQYAGICFFDYERCGSVDRPRLSSPKGEFDVSFGKQACVAGSENVFIVPRAGEKIDLPDLDIPSGYVCIPNEGGVHVRLEGTGRKSRVSAWQE